MNRSLQLRVVPALVAAFLLLAPLAGSAVAQPTLAISGNTVTFRDPGGSNADALTVTQSTSGMTSAYRFVNNAAMLFTLGPCIPNDGATAKDITCTVLNGTGVSISVEGAPGNAAQSVSLSGSWVNGETAQVNSITGGPGGDELIGSNGNETFAGGAGADEFDGGPGSNTVDYSTAATSVHAQIDDSPASGEGCPAACEGDTIGSTIQNITGGSADDVLVGNDAKNTLTGNGGNDQLLGGAGEDTLVGNAGNDSFVGGAGKDHINKTGSGGSDTLDYSLDGRSAGVLVKLAGGEQEAGGTVEDDFASIANVRGTDANDTLVGGTGANALAGMGGDDVLQGEDGAGAVGADDVTGGSGTDTFTYNDGAHGTGIVATLNDKADDGLADADGPDNVSTAGELDNIHADVENITGTDGDDRLSGSLSKNTLDGVSGNDTAGFGDRTDGVVATIDGGGPEADVFKHIRNLQGGAGNDTLIGDINDNRLSGGAGDDTLRGREGHDALVGEAGSDTADYSQDGRAKGVDVDLSAGTAQPKGDDVVEDSGISGVENATGTSHNDTLAGDGGNNRLSGLEGLDSLSGRVGDDVLDPGTGSDGGSDGAADLIQGGNGSDTVTYAARTAAVRVTLDGGTNDGTGDESDRVYPNVENAVGGSGNDTISADTTATHLVVSNALDGGPGADTLTGLAGDDTLTGGTGSDTVTGDDGNDTLKLVDATADTGSCGAGNDTAEADEGIDNIAADCETVKRTAVPPPPVTSTITVDNPSATEGKTGTRKLVFTVKLSEAQAAGVGVTFQTADLTAKAGADYAAQSGALAFAAGETLKTVTVAVTGDKIRERDEQLTLQLSAPTGNAALGSPASGVGTILNDDGVKARRKTPRLLTRVAPRRDRTRPYSFVVTGTVVRPKGVSKTAGCKGKVKVKAGTRKKVLRKRSGVVDKRCHFTVPVTFSSSKGIPSSGRLRFVARFLGNKVLKPKTGKRVRARAG